MLRKSFVFIALIAVLGMVLSGCGAQTSTDTSQKDTGKTAAKAPFKIGAILSLTGDYAGLGAPEKQALELEVKKLNDEGGINGYPVELVVEDDATDPQKTVSAYSKLTTQDKVQCLIGATGTAQSMAIAKSVETDKMPLVCLAGGSVISSPVQKWIFQIPWPNSVVVEKVISYMKDKGFDKAAILTSTDGFGEDGKAVLESALPKADISIVAKDTFDPKGLDFKSQLTGLKDSGADALIVWNAGKGASIVLKNMQELGMKMPFIGSHGNARNEFIAGAGDAAEGAIVPSGKLMAPEAYGDSESGKLAEKFIGDFKAAYGTEPNGTFPGHAYDGFFMTVDALKRMNVTPAELTGSALRDELEKTKDLPLLGGAFTYSATDHFGTSSSDIIMLQVKDGKFSLLK